LWCGSGSHLAADNENYGEKHSRESSEHDRVDAWPSSMLMDMAGHKVGGTSAGKTAITKE
jgi:hypothetical protein